MSDDGYYADSPYDEFEEMLWDADPAPNLADDLAQHASYSPVWQDNPIGELQAYHSDWEYYSDDYYDDDPGILKPNSASGSPPRLQDTAKLGNKRGRKRKLDEVQDPVNRIANQSLRSAIQGTVWAKDETPKVAVFKSGQHERVALLTDWRKRFQTDTNKSQSNLRKKIKRDESWANDLGLMDMGLTRVQDGPRTVQEASVEEGDGDDEYEDNDNITATDDETERDNVVDTVSSQQPIDEMAKPKNNQPHDRESEQRKFQQPSGITASQAENGAEAEGTKPRKKRKLIKEDQLPLSDQDADIVVEGTGHALNPQESVDATSHSRQIHAALSAETSDPSPMSEFEHPDTTSQTLERKRKASMSSENSVSTVNSRPSRRAKRIASDRLKETIGAATTGSKSTRRTRAPKSTGK